MDPVRTGIVGFGRMGERHLAQMRKTGRYDVRAACDRTPARREAAEAQGLTAYERLDDLLDSDIELVLVATHSVRHHPDALRAAEAGKHLFVEKPLALTASQAEEIVSAAQANGVALTVYHNRHNDPDYRLVKAAVRAGRIGRIVAVENRTLAARPAVNFGTPQFRRDWRITAADGGGTLLDFGPHYVEQVLDLMQGRTVEAVFADVRHVRWGDADDLFHADLRFRDGALATVGKADVSFYAPPDKWVILGEDATLHGPVRSGEEPQIELCGPEGAERSAAMIEAVDLHENFADHLRSGAPLVIPPAHALRVMRVLQAMRESAATGHSVQTAI